MYLRDFFLHLLEDTSRLLNRGDVSPAKYLDVEIGTVPGQRQSNCRAEGRDGNPERERERIDRMIQTT
jgi:hypothetical protein